MDISDKVLECFKINSLLTTAEIIDKIGQEHRRAILNHLKRLTFEGQLIKIGNRPYVKYRLNMPNLVLNSPETAPLETKNQDKLPPKKELSPSLFSSKQGLNKPVKHPLRANMPDSGFESGESVQNDP